MKPPIQQTIARWSRAHNRRQFIEELLIASTWVAVSAVLAAGLIRFSGLLVRWDVVSPDRFPSRTAQWAFAIWAIGWVAKIGGTRALWRYRKRRTRPEEFARLLDRRERTHDLITTALAVESRAARGAAPLAELALERARAVLAAMKAPIPPFREPWRTIAGVGIAAALVSFLPRSTDATGPAIAEAAPEVRPPPAEAQARPLSEATLARLEAQAARLAALVEDPTLAPESAAALRDAAHGLADVRRRPSRSLAALSRAEQPLRELTDRVARHRLYDRRRVSSLGEAELAERMTAAGGPAEARAAAARELARRLPPADHAQGRALADRVQRWLDDRGSTPDRTGSSALRDAAERLEEGESDLARTELDTAAEDWERAPGSQSVAATVEAALDEIRRARAERLAHVNEGARADEPPGAASGASGPGAAGGASPPSPAPPPSGPSEPAPSTRAEPTAAPIAVSRVDAEAHAAGSETLELIARAERGHREDQAFRALHRRYEAVAEAAIRREEIPLTRREYIRRYFDAVRRSTP